MIECCSRVNQGTFVIKRFCLEISLGFFAPVNSRGEICIQEYICHVCLLSKFFNILF